MEEINIAEQHDLKPHCQLNNFMHFTQINAQLWQNNTYGMIYRCIYTLRPGP